VLAFATVNTSIALPDHIRQKNPYIVPQMKI
jgi:hypothetical protein